MTSKGPFATYHPSVAFAFLAGAIVVSMAAMHPIVAVISLVGSFICLALHAGWRSALGTLAWAAPVAALVALANMLFSASGSTVLFSFGHRAFYLEALAYGACAASMLVSVLWWFASYAIRMDSEASMALFGRRLPVITLMISQVLRLVPQFVSRGRDIADVQQVLSGGRELTRRQRIESRLRTVSVLMGWGMEDGLIRSESMRARGYGAGRTSYRRHVFSAEDGVLLALILALDLAALIGVLVASSSFTFYPGISDLGAPWCFAPFAALVLVPLALNLKDWFAWR